MAREMPSEYVEGFTASSSWLYRFRRRKGLLLQRKRAKITQSLPKEIEDKIIEFREMLRKLRTENKYEIQQIGNMDELHMTFDLPPAPMVPACITNTSPGNEKSTPMKSTIVNEKLHLTVVLACLADGTKLMPMVVFKQKMAPS